MPLVIFLSSVYSLTLWPATSSRQSGRWPFQTGTEIRQAVFPVRQQGCCLQIEDLDLRLDGGTVNHMILYDSRPFDWTVSEVAKVCAVRNTPEREFALSSTSPSDWCFPGAKLQNQQTSTCPASSHTLNSWARFPVSYRDCSAAQGEVIFPILGHEIIDGLSRSTIFPLVLPRWVELARFFSAPTAMISVSIHSGCPLQLHRHVPALRPVRRRARRFLCTVVLVKIRFPGEHC